MTTKPLMSDAEIRRRKKIQSTSSKATGALGLTALTGTLLATKKGSAATTKAFRLIGHDQPKFLKPKNLKGKTAPILATSAGIGGASSFNFAAYTAAESRKRQQVKKNMDEMAPTYGTVGFAKDWKPVARHYDPEEKRLNRAEKYPKVAAGASAAVAGAAAAKGVKGLDQLAGARAGRKGKLLKVKGVKNLKGAGKLAGVAAAGAGGAAYLKNRNKSDSWSQYAKSATSAFGVSHD